MSETTDFVAIARELGPAFAARAAEHDAADSFVSENYQALRARGLFTAGVPAELGGGGASHAELCAMIRELGRHCSSTALAAAMHTHVVAAMAYNWRGGQQGARSDAAQGRRRESDPRDERRRRLAGGIGDADQRSRAASR